MWITVSPHGDQCNPLNKKRPAPKDWPTWKSRIRTGIIRVMATRKMSSLDHAAATHIRVLAARRNMKQSDVADAADIPRATFGRYWNEERSMTLGDVERVLAALGTDWSQEAEDIRAVMVTGE